MCVAAPLVACGGGDRLPPAGSGGNDGTGGRSDLDSSLGGSSGSDDSGPGGSASGGGQGGAAPDAGVGDNDVDAAGSGGSATETDGGRGPVCGNGFRDALEECDGSDFGLLSCEFFGFDRGTLQCNDCIVDNSGCIGAESCFDGSDNDGDRQADCADTDCDATCSDSCANIQVAPVPGTISGSTPGHAAMLRPTCLRNETSSGAEVVYEVTAAMTGVLELDLVSATANLSLSVRSLCSEAAGELGCADRSAGRGGHERLVVPVVAGEVLFVVVDGSGALEAGSFSLSAASRAIECGDGFRDETEQCDDGRNDDGDGCSAACVLEADETEPNDEVTLANELSAGSLVASVAPVGDVDVFSVQVADPLSTLSVATTDLGDSACANLTLDNFIEILDSNGTTVLALDDDAGTGFCARAVATRLGAGTYFVRVTASGSATTFPYRLHVAVTP